MVRLMINNIKDYREVNPIKIFGLMLPSLPSLMIRLSGNFIRFKGQANKAGKIFKNELIKQGIGDKIADDLTSTYLESSHIRNYIQIFN